MEELLCEIGGCLSRDRVLGRANTGKTQGDDIYLVVLKEKGAMIYARLKIRCGLNVHRDKESFLSSRV